MSNGAVRNTQWVCMCIFGPSRTRCTLQCKMHVCSKHQQSLSCCTLGTGSRYGINCSTSDSRGYEEPVVRALWRSASRAVQEISQQVCLPRSCWDLGAESMPKSGTEKAKRPAHHTSRWSVQDERRRGFVQRWTMCTMARIPVCHFALGQGSALTAESAFAGICRLAPWIPAVPDELLRCREVCGSWLEHTDWRDRKMEHSANARRLCVYGMTDWLHASLPPTLTAQNRRH